MPLVIRLAFRIIVLPLLALTVLFMLRGNINWENGNADFENFSVQIIDDYGYPVPCALLLTKDLTIDSTETLRHPDTKVFTTTEDGGISGWIGWGKYAYYLSCSDLMTYKGEVLVLPIGMIVLDEQDHPIDYDRAVFQINDFNSRCPSYKTTWPTIEVSSEKILFDCNISSR